MIQTIWQPDTPVHAQLAALKPYLMANVKIDNAAINDRVHQLLAAGGKFLRPGFFYLFSQFGAEQDPVRLQAGAAAMELLHVATLIHDDVIDEAKERRHVTTIHQDYGQRNAIYAGDLLFTCYFDQVLIAAKTPADVKVNTAAMRAILQGELDQMAHNFKPTTTLSDYLNVAAGKTACLFSLSCEQGAHLAGASAEIAKLARQIGNRMGLAYQMLDDILDYTGDEEITHKPVLTDLKDGVYSLPLIYALQSDPTLAKLLPMPGMVISNAELLNIRDQVIALGGVTKAQQLATDYTQQALTLINRLPAGSTQQTLRSLVTQLLVRNH
ncbi:polyprenyl synthetase family protein [Lactiplantibacillus fabifermentans]|uniref:Trans-hexaprenyltranstransferase, component II n=2 Tax=Lactiplantibacillus fabifermentans TaxID=483011 RepID=A0A0R2NRV5_9LACO|nr:polyprenyl synthetase family protein [Lactiplantibacillus fabifermentans]ETY74821.1 heptaprenyl diphosphate synthase [Lactiplantibacillus fabifermentans T30PCM01]KRO28407.1 trans-hexaprenyltranstransferase, component II [Lactiplantibacillus fabifermentans DSM 21115]